MFRCHYLVCLAIIAGIPTTLADPLRATVGAGTSMCSAFLREYDKDPEVTAWIYLSWAQGYLSAVNVQRAQLGQTSVDMLPSDFGLPEQSAFLHGYCRNRPDQSFDQAVMEMYRQLRSR